MTKQSINLRKVSSGYQVSIGAYLDKNCGDYLKSEKNSKGQIILTPVRIVDNVPLS